MVNLLERCIVTLDAIFHLDKLYITHFTKNKKKLLAIERDVSLALNRVVIKLFFKLKLLEVVLD